MDVHKQIKYIGRQIHLNRMLKGISLDKLADMSGVSERTIGLIEKGETIPKVDTLCKILSALGYKLSIEMK